MTAGPGDALARLRTFQLLSPYIHYACACLVVHDLARRSDWGERISQDDPRLLRALRTLRMGTEVDATRDWAREDPSLHWLRQNTRQAFARAVAHHPLLEATRISATSPTNQHDLPVVRVGLGERRYVYARASLYGATWSPDRSPPIDAEIGWGTPSTSPDDWEWFPAWWVSGIRNGSTRTDVFRGVFQEGNAGRLHVLMRFKLNGREWTYADTRGYSLYDDAFPGKVEPLELIVGPAPEPHDPGGFSIPDWDFPST